MRNALFFAQLPSKQPSVRANTRNATAFASLTKAEPTVGGQGPQDVHAAGWAPFYTYRAYDMQTATAMSRTHWSHSATVAVPSHASDALNDMQLVQLLALKVGTHVRLQGNVAPHHRLMNGSVGVVTGFLHPLKLLAVADYSAEGALRRCKTHKAQGHAAAEATAEEASPARHLSLATPGQGGVPPPLPSWVQ